MASGAPANNGEAAEAPAKAEPAPKGRRQAATAAE